MRPDRTLYTIVHASNLNAGFARAGFAQGPAEAIDCTIGCSTRVPPTHAAMALDSLTRRVVAGFFGTRAR